MAPPTPPPTHLSKSNAPTNAPTNPSRLRVVDIGYFDPQGVDTTGKTVIYTDVFAFTDMLLHLAETKHNDIRTAIPLYLRGTALFWYSTELTPLERYLLSSVPVSKFCAALISRFKTSPRFDGFNDTQMQQITQALHQIVLRNTPAPPTPSASADKDEEDEDEEDEDEEDEEQPSTPTLTTSPSIPTLTKSSPPPTRALTTSPSIPTLTTNPSTPALIKSSLPLTLALVTSSLLPISSVLTTSSIRSSFADYIKGQIAHLEGIG
jgi:hypothetical protein